MAISGDGSTVVGWSHSQASNATDRVEAFRWTAAEGMIGLGSLPGGGILSRAWAVSYDGSVVVGYGQSDITHAHAARWTIDGNVQELGSINGDLVGSFAYDVSGDGTRIVGSVASTGSSGDRAVTWNTQGQAQFVPLIGTDGSRATSISHDGNVVVGGAHFEVGEETEYNAFLWSQQTGTLKLGDLPGGTHSSLAFRVSADGQTVVGRGTSNEGREAFRWTDKDELVSLGVLSGGQHLSEARGTSEDGSIIVGFSGSAAASEFYADIPDDDDPPFPKTEAVIWDHQHGMRSLREVLIRDYGLDLQDWYLRAAMDISDDGRTIAGHGIGPGGYQQAFVVTIPEPAAASLLLLGGMLMRHRSKTKA